MSTKSLELANVKPLTTTFDGKKQIYQIGELSNENITVSCVPPSGVVPGSITRCSLTWGSDSNNLIVDDIVFDAVVSNASAEDNIFFNPYLRFSSVKLFVNGTEVAYHKDQQSIVSAVSHYCRQNGEDSITQAIMKFVINSTVTSGDTNVANNVPLQLNLPILSVLFPEWVGFVVNSLVYKMDFEFVMTSNFGSPSSNAVFTKSSGVNNSYASVSYGSIALRQLCTRCSDARFLKTVSNKVLLKKWMTKSYSCDFGTADTRSQIINLKNDFSSLNRILGAYLYVQSGALLTTYNDADACRMFSKHTNIGWKLILNSKVLIDYSASSTHAKDRRDYQNEFNLKRWGTRPHRTLLTNGDTIPEVFNLCTYIDLTGIDVFDDETELIGGISNQNNNFELHVYTGAATVNASSTLYCVLEYLEMAEFNKNRDVIVSR